MAIPLIHGKSSAIVGGAVRKLNQEGIISFLRSAADYIYSVSIIFLFRTVFGSITRDEMVQRAQQNGRFWEYSSSESIKISDPDKKSTSSLLRRYSGSYDIERPFVCELDGGYLINSADPLVLTRNRELIMETEKPLFGPQEDGTQADTPFHRRSMYSDSNRVRQLCRGYVQSYNRFSNQTQFETVFPLIRRDPSYAHWLLDQLPAIRGLRRYKEATGSDPTVIVEPDPPNWVRETLSLVGVDTVVPLDVSVARVERFVISSCREHVPRNQSVYEPSIEDINWLNSEMKSRTPSASKEHPDRIYISRENFSDRGRYVTNRRELEDVLAEFGVKIYTPETLSVTEQIRLYENAELIVGPHGAGLTNMIFSEDSSVVELLNIPYPTNQHLAQLCGHDYQFLQCGDGNDHHAPIEVDATHLRELLSDLESRRNH